MQTEKIHKEIEINAPIKKVFNFMTNPHNVPLVLPGLIENTNILELPIKKGNTFNMKYQIIGVVVEGTVEIEEIEFPNTYNFSTKEGSVSHWKEKFMEIDENKTKFILDIEYEPVRAWTDLVQMSVIRELTEKEAEQFLSNSKIVIEMQVAKN